MALILWFAGLVALVVAAAVVSGRARATPMDVVGRGVVATSAIAYAALIVAAVWTWGGTMAAEGRATRLRDGAQVSLSIRDVRVPLAGPVAIGHGPKVTVALPGAGPDVLARVEPATEDPGAPVTLHPVHAGTLVRALRPGDDAARVASHHRCAPQPAPVSLSRGTAALVITCEGDAPRRALVVRRAGSGAELAVTPLVWRGRFVPERLVARAGDALRIGGGDPIPGLTTWEVVGRRASSMMLAVPLDPTDCAAWSPEPGAAQAVADGCALDAGGFVLDALPLLPDAARVQDRGVRAAFAIGLPPLVLLVGLAIARRRGRRMSSLARALRLGVLGAGLVALTSWRLVWAYRIDMLRDLASSGSRVHDNLLAAVAIGATLAGAAASLLPGALRVRCVRALTAWAGWLLIGALVVGVTPSPSVITLGVLGLSLAAALLPLVTELPRPRVADRAWLGPDVVLAVLAIAAFVSRAAAPRTTLLKLGLAYATVLAGHAALRTLVAAESSLGRRLRLACALALSVAAIASYDHGVALAITGTGLALAMLVAGHDAIYDASHAGRIGLLEREHARVLLVHGLATIVLALGVAGWALASSDHELLAQGPVAMLHVPLGIAVLFGIAALLARSHRRGWVPWVAAALAALAMWGAREAALARATSGTSVSARRVAALVEPGYALLRDERSFAATVSAWREVALDPVADVDAWRGQGYFGARIRDPGVSRSLDNDYLPVLVAREAGVAGVTQGIALLLVLVVAAGALASVRMRHASREQRARWLAISVVATLAVYQPLAAFGVVPFTGISWPGLGLDSPADLWVFVIGAVWCVLAGDGAPDDERVRRTPRLARARRIVLVGLAVTGAAAILVVARAGGLALERVADDDARVVRALDYAESLACEWTERDGASLSDVVPTVIAGEPTDGATARFDGELRAAWSAERDGVVAALEACQGAGPWQLARSGETCVATRRFGWPELRLRVQREGERVHARCEVVRDDGPIAALRARPPSPAQPRIRVVSTPLGVAARDVGEVVAGTRIVRLRPGAPEVALSALGDGVQPAARVTVAADVVLEADPRGAVVRGPAELFVATEPGGWKRLARTGEVALDRLTLVVAGPRDHRTLVLYRPRRSWGDAPATVDPLLADETRRLGDRPRRVYPYGASLPELGWVNPFELDRSLGLDGWIHAAQAPRERATDGPACGTLSPPPIPREQVCQPSPLDGALECRVSLQPELAQSLRQLARDILGAPKAHTGRDVLPARVAYVVLRGDTGELLAQGNVVPGRPPLAYAPVDAAAEAELIRLRNTRGEADAERVEWNLPIAVGSTFKPLVARALELAAPDEAAALELTAAGSAPGCKARRGQQVAPILGHCPPTSVAGSPTTADLHAFLARSPNWYQAAIGLLGLALPAGQLAAGATPVTLADIQLSDLASWPPEMPLQISDAKGTILGPRGLSIAGLRRTPLWTRLEQLLGRPLCTLGDRASCERAAARRDVCAARALPVPAETADLRYLVALGPDRVDPYTDNRAKQTHIAVREYLQLLRGSGALPIGSLAQLTDAFGRVVYDFAGDVPRLAASWFPAPAVGTTPSWSCALGAGRSPTVLGADGGLCAVVRPGGTAHAALAELLAEPKLVVYGAKTGTIDSLADIARRPAACKAWNKRNAGGAQLTCGKTPPDDSLLVLAFGVVTPQGTIPITLGIQLQRGGAGSASRVAPAFVRAIAAYLGG